MSSLLPRVREFIFNQFYEPETQAELKSFNYDDNNWVERTEKSLHLSIGPLVEIAGSLLKALEHRYNVMERLYEHCSHDSLITRDLDIANDLIAGVESSNVSQQIQTHLAENIKPKLYENGANSYPDLYFADFDYSMLPEGRKNLPETHPEGVYLSRYRQLPLRPNKAPDGIEIKATRQNPLSIMAHAPHPGLHFAVKYEPFGDGTPFKVRDVMLGFLARHKYRIPARTTEAETIKVFLEERHFVSIMEITHESI